MENPHKYFEDARQRTGRSEAYTFGNLGGQVRNTPEQIAKAVTVCKFFGVDASITAFKADPKTTTFTL